MPNYPAPVPDFLFAPKRMLLPLPLLPPLRPLLLLQRFFLSVGLSLEARPLPASTSPLCAREEDESAQTATEQELAVRPCAIQLRAGTEVQEAHQVRVQSPSVARSLQGVGEPAACASLFDASTSQSGRAARLPRDRQGGPFPSAARGRRGAEPAVSLGAQQPRRRRRQAGAAAAQARGQPSAHPRRAPCAAESSEERGSRDPGVDKARWQGS